MAPTLPSVQKSPHPAKLDWAKGNLRSTTRFNSSGRLCAEEQHCRRRGRLTEVLQPFCQEPLPWYKILEPARPQWPDTFHAYSLKSPGTLRALDNETVMVDAGDVLEKTKQGLLRSSTGHVTYSAKERMAFELDAEDLVHLLQQTPQGKLWTLTSLEQAFRDQLGRRGSWAVHHIALGVFLAMFPRTFYVFGDFVRVLHASRTKVVDDGEDVMVRLALTLRDGVPAKGLAASQSVPDLGSVRVKAKFRPSHKMKTDADGAAGLARSSSFSGSNRTILKNSTLRLPPVDEDFPKPEGLS